MARHHVVRGREIIARQREIIEEAHERGSESSVAEKMLAQFEMSQAIFEDDFDRLPRGRDGQ
jgi:hypothetical protein